MGILSPDMNYSLRPMKYPQFYDNFVKAQANNWSIQEISFDTDRIDLRDHISPAEKHVISRLIAFFATGDVIVNNNVVLNLYKHVNSVEARLYYSRQCFEEALHIQFYTVLLDNYLPDMTERQAAFDAIRDIPSIKRKADFCFKWMDQMAAIDVLDSDDKRRIFLMNLITFAAAVEGLFFFAAFAYVYYLRSGAGGKIGLLHGFASGTNWVFRDESMHMNVAFDVVDTIRQEYPQLWDKEMETNIVVMLKEAMDCEMQFADDALNYGVVGLSRTDMEQYLKFVVDLRLKRFGMMPLYEARNPFPFMDLQGMQTLTNQFERTVSEYTMGISGDVTFDAEF